MFARSWRLPWQRRSRRHPYPARRIVHCQGRVVLLKDEEEHVDFLEAQMHQIKELGYERYLSMQMGEDEEE